MKPVFESGQYNTICDRCGFKFKSGELRKTWDNLWVCPDDWEPRHISDFLKSPGPERALPWTRPEPAEIDGSPTYISETIGVQEANMPETTVHGQLDELPEQPSIPITNNLVDWFRYGIGITNTPQGVTRWENQANPALPLTVIPTINPPKLRDDNSLYFPAGPYSLGALTHTLTDPLTIYILVRLYIPDNSDGRIITGSGSTRLGYDNDGTLRFRGASSPPTENNSAWSYGTYIVIACRTTGGGTGVEMFVDGISEDGAGAGVGDTTFTTFRLGNPTTSGNFDIRELAVYNIAHTDEQVATITAYLTQIKDL